MTPWMRTRIVKDAHVATGQLTSWNVCAHLLHSAYETRCKRILKASNLSTSLGRVDTGRCRAALFVLAMLNSLCTLTTCCSCSLNSSAQPSGPSFMRASCAPKGPIALKKSEHFARIDTTKSRVHRNVC